ncbi:MULTISPECIES: acetate--CoA ligase [Pseudoalteromonas]|jgi:acetyl-CoA synthetase|uniref:acetate--CoA ligase n=1 Tax=Pseudoalteromonas TaxID=53246 RepID=UPI0023570C2F|nr:MULTISPECIES: acetate--CoA ligase [Pseudoalteromonas]MDN3400967.1 acetate--CoA ligase [Pseudoalteromonas sp. APC 3213]MDN3409864.1 acetate--CoA ligase [Pseudoalteromonas sp. APC 3894]MDN3415013.1 acetate--CoA ligase [Pseudoalteromonas sp. APC 3227]MDN3418711.1 acetate--CoA ligase [Pseudoalteromonas sp. APC 3895]MDN3424249.1 acetate--CoA ligase [Pseudoalteromonas sp. APC 3896]|tara:strand:+ start:5577 stop:7517 length:1941 start_codon:yes stop_codon:yes gene_type:complete
MSQSIYPVPAHIKNAALVDNEKYNTMYKQSVEDPEGFWAEHGKRLDWFTPYSKVKNTSFDKGHINIKWYEDGYLNASYNCIDRHLKTKSDKVALIWEGDDPSQSENITYQQLHDEVAKFANGLKKLGVKKGDRVAIYMPMSPQAIYAMQACARIGAIHSVIFGGFSPSAIADRINDSGAKVVITSDEGRRAGNCVPLKANVDEAVLQDSVTTVEHVVVHKLTSGDVDWHSHDIWWHDLVADEAPECEPERMNAEDPLFILYTSGSTGQPKGVVHTTGGYLVYSSMTHEYVFDLKEDDIFWCSADVGWITGHSYIAYGPLVNGCTQVVFEGVPTYPTAGRMGEVVDKHNVTILYTAPTAIRALMAKGDEPIASSNRDSLRILGSVGEPINPEAWTWYYEKIGKSNCPIVDTWWQTETGGIMIAPLPGATDMKPGSATRPFFGIAPALFDAEGNTLEGAVEGNLVILDSWPSQARTVYGDHERFEQTYFSAYPGVYFTGDGCRRDEDGDYWITGRVDDVLNVSGHRLGTAEIESALVAHEAVAEAAVVGYPHDIKGQGIYVYITPNEGVTVSDELTKEIRNWVRKELSPIASPDMIQWSPGLPKTRSGKIMRRILRKIAANEYQQLGDTSTLADPSVVDELVENRLNR